MNLGSPEFGSISDRIDEVLDCDFCERDGIAFKGGGLEQRLILERVNAKRQELNLPAIDFETAAPAVYEQVDQTKFKTLQPRAFIVVSVTTDLLSGKEKDMVERTLETTEDPISKGRKVNAAKKKLTQVIKLIKAGKVPNYISVNLTADDNFKLAAQELGLIDEVAAKGRETIKIFDTGVEGQGLFTKQGSDSKALAGEEQEPMGVVLELRQRTDFEGKTSQDQLSLWRLPAWEINERLHGR